MPDDTQTRAEQDADTEYTVDVRPDRKVPRREPEPVAMSVVSEAAEARALRRRVRELEKENEQLRNALAIAFPDKDGA